MIINNENSDFVYVTYGVPQGSTGGPMFLLLFIKNLSDASPNLDSFGFADDFKCIVLNSEVITGAAKT